MVPNPPIFLAYMPKSSFFWVKQHVKVPILDCQLVFGIDAPTNSG
jgi:hypothetical protein